MRGIKVLRLSISISLSIYLYGIVISCYRSGGGIEKKRKNLEPKHEGKKNEPSTERDSLVFDIHHMYDNN